MLGGGCMLSMMSVCYTLPIVGTALVTTYPVFWAYITACSSPLKEKERPVPSPHGHYLPISILPAHLQGSLLWFQGLIFVVDSNDRKTAVCISWLRQNWTGPGNGKKCILAVPKNVWWRASVCVCSNHVCDWVRSWACSSSLFLKSWESRGWTAWFCNSCIRSTVGLAGPPQCYECLWSHRQARTTSA